MLRNLVICIVTGLALSAAEPVGVIVSELSPPRQLTREGMIELLNGRVMNWPDGQRVVLVISYSPAGKAAVQTLVARDVARLMRGWKRLVFGLGGSLPQTVNDDATGMAVVARTPNSVLPLAGQPVGTLPAGVRYVDLP